MAPSDLFFVYGSSANANEEVAAAPRHAPTPPAQPGGNLLAAS